MRGNEKEARRVRTLPGGGFGPFPFGLLVPDLVAWHRSGANLMSPCIQSCRRRTSGPFSERLHDSPRAAHQVGFSLHIRRIKLQMSVSTFARPTVLAYDFQRQYILNPCSCQRTTASGSTIGSADRQFDHNPDSQTQKKRSTRRILSRNFLARRTASCRRSARYFEGEFAAITKRFVHSVTAMRRLT
jgi:hypothetical protein